MTRIFTIKKYFGYTLLLVLCAISSVLGQNLSDKEIGFDVDRVTASLKAQGIPEKYLNTEINRMRQIRIKVYNNIEIREKKVLQKSTSQEKSLKTINGKLIDIDPIEKLALKDLYDNTNGPIWTRQTGWDFNTPVTSWDGTNGWYGVTVSNDGHIIRLQLQNNNLTGTIPTSFGNLIKLIDVILWGNKLTGNIPMEIGNLTSLNYIDLGNNNLIGDIPVQIGQLVNLSHLGLEFNQLTSIPTQINRLKKLVYLRVQNNQLVGNIPKEIGDLTNLYQLALNNNQLSGEIPKEIGKMSSLVQLFLSTNRLTGKLPTEINQLSNLILLNIGTNELSGLIPDLSTLPGFYALYSSSNKFRFIDYFGGFTKFKSKFAPFQYFPQAKTDLPETITKSTGQTVDLKMCTDERFLANDTFQWFKNGAAITGATSRIYTISNLNSSNIGTYTCKSYHSADPDMSPLVLEREPITLNVVNCTLVTGQLSFGDCIPSKGGTCPPYTCGSRTIYWPSVSITGGVKIVDYQWAFKSPDGSIIGTAEGNNPQIEFTFPTVGNNSIELTVTDDKGCKTTFSTTVPVIACVKSCPVPTNVVVSNVNISSATVSWTETGTATSWIVAITAFGAGEPSNNVGTITTQNPYYISYFPSGFPYQVYVKAVCGPNNQSGWSNPVTLVSSANGCPVTVTNTEEASCINKKMTFSFNSPTSGVTYNWVLYGQNLDQIDTSNQASFTTVVSSGNKLVLTVTDSNGNKSIFIKNFGNTSCCNDISNLGGNIQTESLTCINQNILFTFNNNSPATNYTYEWSFVDDYGVIISTSKEKNFTVNSVIAGAYTVKLIVTNPQGCSILYTNYFNIKNCSCALTNPKSEIVKKLVSNLINSLITRAQNGETDAQINGSNPQELIALRPYIIFGGDKIYNFVSIRNSQGLLTGMQFSFSTKVLYNIYLSDYYGLLPGNFSIDLSEYISSSEVLTTCVYFESKAKISKVKKVSKKEDVCENRSEIVGIDFCPPACTTITSILNLDLINPNPDGSICSETKIAFSLSNPETLPAGLTYNWIFYDQDDTTILEEYTNTDVVFEYPEQGEYNVKLIVTDATGCKTEFLRTITVNECTTVVVGNCDIHFNFNFKMPDRNRLYGGYTLDLKSRLNFARGVTDFLSNNLSKKLFLTSFDDESDGARLLTNNREIITNPGVVNTATPGSSEVIDEITNYIRLQDNNNEDTFSKIANSISSNALINNINVSFFFISDDKFRDINVVKSAYQNLINSNKTKKVFFVLVQEGQIANVSNNTFLSTLDFISQIKGTTPVNYETTNSIYTSDYIMYTENQILAQDFKNTLSAFLQKSYNEVRKLKCPVGSCTKTNPNTAVVKKLYIKLANHLLSKIKIDGTIPNGYNPQELQELAPYITDPNPRIFNVTYADSDLKYSFTNHTATQYDVLIRNRDREITDVNLNDYSSPEKIGYYQLKYKTVGFESKHTVQHINFCPDSLFVPCTPTNLRTERAKLMFVNLINHLRKEVKEGRIIKEGYNCLELIKLKPYLLDYENPKIYGFTESPLSFSFHPKVNADDYDVKLYLPSTGDVNVMTADIGVYGFQNSSNYTAVNLGALETVNSGISQVRHINFCPEPICVNHIAIVVDESGSINQIEKTHIKRQLKAFIMQQAEANDNDDGNMYLSLIGMSDSDNNNREDHILYKKITAGAALAEFNDWLDKFGQRYGTKGVSQGADFWKSGLDAALGSGDKKPNTVILITDGSQTNDLSGLKNTMSRFNNYGHPSQIDKSKPHLYVVGIDNGFYVYDDLTANRKLTRDQDPNFNLSLKAASTSQKVTSSLTLSLKYLLNLVDAEFPNSDISDFAKDYFAHSDFAFIGDQINDHYFSNELKQSVKIDCGEEFDSNRCDTCFSFQPEPRKTYILNAWAKEESNVQLTTYTNPKIIIRFKDFDKNVISEILVAPKGDVIEGWQRLWEKFEVPYVESVKNKQTVFIEFELVNESRSVPVFFDDIRIHPVKSSMKSFVYDPETFRLMSELDENNYSTYYEYDNEGGLVRIKKETAKGVKTIQETRSGTVIKNE
jgi:hypothetical protein